MNNQELYNKGQIKNIQMSDIDKRDAPEYCDAQISFAQHADGTSFTEQELKVLNQDYSFVNNMAHEHVVCEAEYRMDCLMDR